MDIFLPFRSFISILLVVFILFHSCCDGVAATSDQRRPYIVHVHSNGAMSRQQWHQSFLPANSSQGLLFSYKHAMSGFAAMLTEEEVEALSKKDGFLHAHPSRNYKLHTTHSLQFLGLMKPPIGRKYDNIWRDKFGYGKGVIIGVLDTGISSTHPSFDDSGMSPPPWKWNGSCEAPIVCNNKLIGAKSFIFNPNMTSKTIVDENGHGTHTASTAAGQFVDGASLLGSAEGTASGVSPRAHLAIYKVCQRYCPDASILAGMDSAIEDGVDVISLSLGSLETSLYNDVISIASFRAVAKGIFVSASVGNRGPTVSTLGNASPWIFTVGASTIDRKILSIVKLSNGYKFQGESAYQPANFNPSSLLPLVYPESDKDTFSPYCCNVTTLKRVGVEGKVVLCEAGIVNREVAGSNVEKAGGVAMIWIPPSRYGFQTSASADVIPTSGVNFPDGQTILSNYYKNPNLTVTIEFLGTKIGGDYSTPKVASFSSRGPSKITPGFIKPDAIGPGVNILAAWPYPVGAYNISPAFNIISGTSMSCPHLSGVAALLRSAHPDWSPASIKSAIITTSYWNDRRNDVNIVDQYDHRAASFNLMGSGHVNPIKACNPGLVYETTEPNEEYYLPYLCGLNYTDKHVSMFTGKKSMCSDVNTTIDGVDLNYPSVVVAMGEFNNYSRSFSRVVTNVAGLINYSYDLILSPPHGVNVDIEPETLEFTSNTGPQIRFTVRVTLDTMSQEYASPLEEYGYFAWISMDKKFTVWSPIIVTKEGNFNIGGNNTYT